MDLPILSGVVTDGRADFRSLLPTNCMPVPMPTGISDGYLRIATGIRTAATVGFNSAFGPDRGGYAYNGRCYRVIGEWFCRVDDNGDGTATVVQLKQFGLGAQVTFTETFDRLIICVNGQVWYFNDASNTFTQITDADLGVPIDAEFVDGYTVFTDGAFIGVTELNDPLAVETLKYGSSEVSPDPIVALLKLRNELHAINRYTVEAFDNVGGSGFPFQRIDTAALPRGAVGTHACAVYMDAIAFLGGARNEPPAVWLGGAGQTTKISTREIDKRLAAYPEAQLPSVLMEVRTFDSHSLLYIHLPDITLVYDGQASAAAKQPIWCLLSSGADGTGAYRGRGFVWCYNKWICGDGSDGQRIGYLDESIASHFGLPVGYEFATQLQYNEGRGLQFHAIELVCTSGASVGTAEDFIDQSIRHSYTLDGRTWSRERLRTLGKAGQRNKRPMWLNCGTSRNWRADRFRGCTSVPIAFARCEAKIEPLAF